MSTSPENIRKPPVIWVSYFLRRGVKINTGLKGFKGYKAYKWFYAPAELENSSSSLLSISITINLLDLW